MQTPANIFGLLALLIACYMFTLDILMTVIFTVVGSVCLSLFLKILSIAWGTIERIILILKILWCLPETSDSIKSKGCKHESCKFDEKRVEKLENRISSLEKGQGKKTPPNTKEEYEWVNPFTEHLAEQQKNIRDTIGLMSGYVKRKKRRD